MNKLKLNIFANIIIIFLLACIGISISYGNLAQFRNLFFASEKRVQKENLPILSPVEIVDIRVGNEQFEFGQPYVGKSRDWLRSVTFKIHNLTNKKIVFMELRIDLPETKKSGPEMSHRLAYGSPPAVHRKNSNSLNESKEILELLPGEEFEIRIEDDFERLERLISSRDNINSINTLMLRFGPIIFEDGARWESFSGWVNSDSNNKITMLKTLPQDYIISNHK